MLSVPIDHIWLYWYCSCRKLASVVTQVPNTQNIKMPAKSLTHIDMHCRNLNMSVMGFYVEKTKSNVLSHPRFHLKWDYIFTVTTWYITVHKMASPQANEMNIIGLMSSFNSSMRLKNRYTLFFFSSKLPNKIKQTAIYDNVSEWPDENIHRLRPKPSFSSACSYAWAHRENNLLCLAHISCLNSWLSNECMNWETANRWSWWQSPHWRWISHSQHKWSHSPWCWWYPHLNCVWIKMATPFGLDPMCRARNGTVTPRLGTWLARWPKKIIGWRTRD